MVKGIDVLLNLRGVPNMVETMVLTDDMVGLMLTKISESRFLCGATILEVCVGPKLSVIKDTVEATVEVGPSTDKGGATIPKVGLFRSKYGRGGGDALFLLGEGGGKGVW